MDDSDLSKLRGQLRQDIKNARKEIPRELQDELMMRVREEPVMFAMPHYHGFLKVAYPEYKKQIDRIFGGQLALGRILKWNDGYRN